MVNLQNLLLLQLIAHLISDFFCQNEKVCTQKRQRGFRTWHLYGHAVLTFLIAWLFSFSLNYVVYALIIAISHLLIDGIKSFLRKWKYVFITDQIAHIAIIAVVVYFYNQRVGVCLPYYLPKTYWLLLILGGLICMRPTNVLIQDVLNKFNLNSRDRNLEKAGRVIGSLERLLTLILVLLGQYQAIGFIIAAKSILRFKDTATAKTEYVLIGTLLSFGVAVVVGVTIMKIKKLLVL